MKIAMVIDAIKNGKVSHASEIIDANEYKRVIDKYFAPFLMAQMMGHEIVLDSSDYKPDGVWLVQDVTENSLMVLAVSEVIN